MNRGFEIVSNFENLGLVLPVRKTKYSAGYDLALAEDIIIEPGKVVIAKTGMKAYMMDDEVLYIYPRSSLSLGKTITLTDGTKQQIFVNLANNVGVIDKDYYNNPDNEGHICLLLHNFGDKTIKLEKSTFVAQGVFQKYLCVDNETLDINDRVGGFGSTDK